MNTAHENKPVPSEGKDGANNDGRNWAMLAHLLGLIGMLVPLGNIFAPLILWAVKKEEFPLVADQGKEALNFQITITIGYIICVILMFVLIGFVLLVALLIYNVITVIIAATDANAGKSYRYPVTLRLVK